MNNGVVVERDGADGRTYRALQGLLQERSPEADSAEAELLDDVRRIVANMEADLARTMEELEALRGEEVFDPNEYVQRFTYAGRRVHVSNQERRSIVDIHAPEPLRGTGISPMDVRDAYSVYTSPDSPARWAGCRRSSVDTILAEVYDAALARTGEDRMQAMLDDFLTDTAYSHAYVSGDATERIDDILALARTPFEERPTEAEGYTVRMDGGVKMQSGRIVVQAPEQRRGLLGRMKEWY